MTENPDDRTTGDEVDQGDVERTPAPAGGSREPLISGDPLGLGGEPAPDAPSRSPKPKLLSLAGEFLQMSRNTAILLAVFVMVGALYLLVKEDPTFNVGPREPAVPVETTTPDSTGETPSSVSTAPTSSVGETTAPSGTTPTSAVTTTQGNDDETVEPTVGNSAPVTPASSVPVPGGAGGPTATGAGSPDGEPGARPDGGAADRGTSPGAL